MIGRFSIQTWCLTNGHDQNSLFFDRFCAPLELFWILVRFPVKLNAQSVVFRVLNSNCSFTNRIWCLFARPNVRPINLCKRATYFSIIEIFFDLPTHWHSNWNSFLLFLYVYFDLFAFRRPPPLVVKRNSIHFVLPLLGRFAASNSLLKTRKTGMSHQKVTQTERRHNKRILSKQFNRSNLIRPSFLYSLI